MNQRPQGANLAPLPPPSSSSRPFAVTQITHRPRKTRSGTGFPHPAGAASHQKSAEEVMQTGVSSDNKIKVLLILLINIINIIFINLLI